jgi:RNA polymerase sigma-70 factor (ECF subfamily)
MIRRDATPGGPASETRPESAIRPARTRAPVAPGEPSDEALVERARAGEDAAFRRLVERYQRRAYQLALGIVKDHEEAMDVVQDAFLKAHRSLPGFKGDSAFFTWLYRITYNLSIDALRKGGRAPRTEVDERTITDEESQHETFGQGSANPQKAMLRGELGVRLEEALSQLGENHRAILLLREVEGLSYEELSETLNIPKGTVMSRLFHARQKMQAALKGYLEDEGAVPGGRERAG